jgi:hypothetical protein
LASKRITIDCQLIDSKRSLVHDAVRRNGKVAHRHIFALSLCVLSRKLPFLRQIKIPCLKDHHHMPWPTSGLHEQRIEQCETQCGWCRYKTVSAVWAELHPPLPQ